MIARTDVIVSSSLVLVVDLNVKHFTLGIADREIESRIPLLLDQT